MRVFITRAFGRFARKEQISDTALCEAIERAVRGLIDADLGGGVIKQRVARLGEGRSSGYRMLIAFRSETRAVFLFGFAKGDQDNIDNDELRELRRAAREMLGWNDKGIAALLASGAWTEIDCDGDEIQE